mgnify:CR=1 FL=1
MDYHLRAMAIVRPFLTASSKKKDDLEKLLKEEKEFWDNRMRSSNDPGQVTALRERISFIDQIDVDKIFD